MKEKIMLAIAEYLQKEVLHQPNRKLLPTDKLITSGWVNSFSLVDVSLFIEDKFGVVIDDTELNKDTFDTLEELATLVSSRLR